MSRKKLSGNRRNKRGMYKQAGFLKIKNNYPMFGEVRTNWYAKNAEEGRTSFAKQVQETQDAIENQLQTILNSCKETWAQVGYNAEAISKLEEAFTLTAIKNRETLNSDRKLAKKLLKEANQSLASK